MLVRLDFEKTNHARTPATVKLSIFLKNADNINSKLENVVWKEIKDEEGMIKSFIDKNPHVSPIRWNWNYQVDKVQIFVTFEDSPNEMLVSSIYLVSSVIHNLEKFSYT